MMRVRKWNHVQQIMIFLASLYFFLSLVQDTHHWHAMYIYPTLNDLLKVNLLLTNVAAKQLNEQLLI
jgi:hypothetical protein